MRSPKGVRPLGLPPYLDRIRHRSLPLGEGVLGLDPRVVPLGRLSRAVAQRAGHSLDARAAVLGDLPCRGQSLLGIPIETGSRWMPSFCPD